MEKIQCSCEYDNVDIFPCAGAANAGPLSNKAALYLTGHGAGTMMCIAGIGAHQHGITRSAQGCYKIVVIDGCKLACAKNCLEHAGIRVHKHIVLTELGIKKSKDLDMKPTEVKNIMEQVKAILQ
ncbi:MAG: putative zinc-binding protein [Methanosarcinales archaeon]|nr:putative zinc-binding protein [Methanosarcinales archaeon]